MRVIRKRLLSVVAHSAIVCNFLLALATVGFSAFGQSAAMAHLQQAIVTNSLDSDGKPAFHIRISFQLYDLAGAPEDSGTIEEWWASPGVSRVAVTAGSLKAAGPTLLNDQIAMDSREKYFIQQLLASALHPIPPLTSTFAGSVKEGPQTFDKTSLTCFSIIREQASGTGLGPSKLCTDSSTYALRMELDGQLSTTARNGIGLFHETHVSTAIDIAYEDLQVISGKVTVLQSFDPAKSDVVLPANSVVQEDRSGIVSGKNLTHPPPSYPAVAKASHTGGTVVLHAIITKQGTTKEAFVLASRSPALTQAALEAVRNWTYKPFLRNGQPTEVETVIQVNFNIQ